MFIQVRSVVLSHECDVIVVTGDAYIDHPSFGMALVGRLLEALDALGLADDTVVMAAPPGRYGHAVSVDVTGDKIYCIYIAPNKEMVLEHARLGGFPANSISRIRAVIDPTTAE